jgi:hypothetical protein
MKRALSLAIGAAASLFAATAMAEDAPASQACEVHVWGAIPTYKPGTFAGPGARVGTIDADRSDPVANINVFDPLVRLGGIEDKWLALLAGADAKAKVIRHSAPIDVALAKSAKRPLFASTSPCYTDFVLLELYDIGKRPDDRYLGLLTELLIARNGFHATYIVNRFGPGGRLLSRTKDSQITPLAIDRPHWRDNPTLTVAALDDAIRIGIRDLASRLADKP